MKIEMKLKDSESLERMLFADPEFRKEYFNSDDLLFNVSRMVRKIRMERGLTQLDLAKKVGTKQSSIARLESGKNGLPSLRSLEKISKSLGVPVVWFILPRLALFRESETEIFRVGFPPKDDCFVTAEQSRAEESKSWVDSFEPFVSQGRTQRNNYSVGIC